MFGATVIDGDIDQQARARVAIAVGILMGRKNVPRSACNCEDMAAAIVARLDMRQRFMIVHDTPDEETSHSIDWMANYWLDRDAAINMINIFARVASIGEIPESAFNALLDSTLAQLKRCNPFSDEFLVWPTSEAIEERAIASIGRDRPVDLATLEQAMRPLLAPPVPESPEAKTRWQAWRTVANAVASLMERKNVRPGVISSEGIAGLIVEGMSGEEHVALANGVADEQAILRINTVAENEIDFCAATTAIRILARAGDIGDMSDLELIEMAGRMIDRRKSDCQINDTTLVWPSPMAVELLASRCFRTRPPRDLAAFEAAIVPLLDAQAQP